jgi:O-methyltransferase
MPLKLPLRLKKAGKPLDGAFRSVAEIYTQIRPYTLVDFDRCSVLYRFARHASFLGGDVAEVGVYRGGTTLLLAAACPNKTIHAFDTFSGLPNCSYKDSHHVNGDFDLDGVVPPVLKQRANVQVHVGLFPDTVKDMGDSRYCLAHFDGDTYVSAVAFLNYFYPRTVPGGVLIFDDYLRPSCQGVTTALREFESKIGAATIQTSEFQGVIIRSQPLHL